MTASQTIAGNSVLLILRSGVLWVSNLAVAGLLVRSLGVADYGLWTAVLGTATFLSIFNGTLQTTAQRYLSRGYCEGRNLVEAHFASVLVLTLMLALGVIVVGETGGLWYVTMRLKVVAGSLADARTALHLAVAIIAVRTLRIPVESLFVASERMVALPVMGLFEAVLAVCAAMGASCVTTHRIVGYATLLLAAEVACLVVLSALAKRRLGVTLRFRRASFGNFSGQSAYFLSNAIRSASNMFKYQGVLLLLGAYAGIVFCSTWDVTMKIGFGLGELVIALQTAYFPVAVKQWTEGRMRTYGSVLARIFGSSVVLMTALTLPLMVCPELILRWLFGPELPLQAAAFMRCIAVNFLIDAAIAPLQAAVLATGRVVGYQLVVSFLSASGFGLAWLGLSAGLPAWIAVAAVSFVNFVSLIYRSLYLKFRWRVLSPSEPLLSPAAGG